MILRAGEQLEKTVSRRKTCLLLFSVCAAFWLGASVTLLVISKGRDYTPYMIADMAMGVVFGWAAVWFFTNPFADLTHTVRLFKKMTRSNIESVVGTVTKIEEITKDKIYFLQLTVSAAEGERYLYLLPGYAGCVQACGRYAFKAQASVVIKCEAADE